MPDIELSRWQGNVGVGKLLDAGLLDAGFYISIFSGDIHIQSKLRTVLILKNKCIGDLTMSENIVTLHINYL